MNKIGAKQSTSTDNDEIDLSALLGELVLNKWLIILITLATLSLGVLYAYRQVPQYESDILLQVDSGRAGLAKEGLVEQLASGGGGSANAAITQIALIQSRFILDPIIQLLHLDIDVIPKYQSIWDRLFHQKKLSNNGIQIDTFDVPKDQLNQRYYLSIDKTGFVSLFNAQDKLVLQGKEGVRLSNKNDTIHLKVKSINSPVGSQFTVIKRSNAQVMKSLLKRLSIQETGGKGFQAGTGILSVKLIGENPYKIINILNEIALTAKAKDAKKKAQEASQTLDFLQQQLPITKDQLKKAEYDLNQYRVKSGKIDFKLQTQALITQFAEVEKEINRLRIEKVNMQQQYTLEHPMMIALVKQLKSLQAQRQELEQTLKKLPASDQVAVNLLRDVKVTKTLYMILLSKIHELQVVKAGTISSLHILSMAKMPEEPLPSHLSLIYLASIGLGFILSIFIIFVHRMLSSKIEDPHWSERHFNLPNIAIIPYCKEQKLSLLSLDTATQLPLLANINPKNLTVESLRSLRTSLQVSLAGAKNNIVSILGMSPGVGKSFISANTAYLLASAGKKVLLIDADLRRGTMHKYLNILPSPGLAELLNGSVDIEQALITTQHENLYCITRGNYPQDPSELLMSSKFKTLLQTLSEKFDLVIIDTAPVLLVTDAVIVSAIAGTNYLILGSGIHQPADVEMALKRLLSAGVHLHGSIFNYTRPQLKKVLASKYGHYSYSYYYDETIKAE